MVTHGRATGRCRGVAGDHGGRVLGSSHNDLLPADREDGVAANTAVVQVVERTGSVGGRLHDQPGDVLIWPVPGPGILKPEYPAPVDRERLHLHQHPAGSWFGHAGLGDSNQRPGTAGGWLPLDQAEADWQISTIGWISGLQRDYPMAVLTTGNPTKQYGISTIDGLSGIVWKNLG